MRLYSDAIKAHDQQGHRHARPLGWKVIQTVREKFSCRNCERARRRARGGNNRQPLRHESRKERSASN
jgi:hypothetical protein